MMVAAMIMMDVDCNCENDRTIRMCLCANICASVSVSERDCESERICVVVRLCNCVIE